MKGSAKSPYEIRLELLQLAFNILTTEHSARAAAEAPNAASVLITTTSPTVDDVINTASLLNEFISVQYGNGVCQCSPK